MKNKIKFLSLFGCLLFAMAFSARAQLVTSNLLFNPALPAGTNYSAIFAASGNLRISGGTTFQFNNGGLNATNALYWKIQIAINDTNNFADVARWYHAGTNYTFDIDSTNINNMPVYIRFAAVNTNASATLPGVSGTIQHP